MADIDRTLFNAPGFDADDAAQHVYADAAAILGLLGYCAVQGGYFSFARINGFAADGLGEDFYMVRKPEKVCVRADIGSGPGRGLQPEIGHPEGERLAADEDRAPGC